MRPGIGTLLVGIVVAIGTAHDEATAQATSDPTDARPNVLLVMYDTLRWDHCSAYGYEHDTTPAMRRLASEGVLFEYAYAPTSTTLPSTVSLLTSLHPITHGSLSNFQEPDDSLVSLPSLLQKDGYQTALIASSPVLRKRLVLKGFDHRSITWVPSHTSEKIHPRTGYRSWNKYDRRAKFAVNALIKWMEESRDEQRPFFALLHVMDPHEPYTPIKEYRAKWLPNEEDMSPIEKIRALYDADIAYSEDELARLFEYLQSVDQFDNTLIIVTADHGQELNEHGWLGHAVHVYEESVRVPLVMRYPPKITAGSRVQGPVELIDLAPTILRYAGVSDESSDFTGRDLGPVLEGSQSLSFERPVVVQRQFYEPGQKKFGQTLNGEKFAVRAGNWKYIEARGENRFELYDLSTDPGERQNVVADHEDVRARLSAHIESFRATYGRDEAVSETSGTLSEEDREALEALGYVE